jgi:hypothetical protein
MPFSVPVLPIDDLPVFAVRGAEVTDLAPK